MRFKLLLAMCLATMPMCLVGCDSGGENTVGTGSKEPPPDVKERIEKEAKMREDAAANAAKNPTPSDGRTAPPGG
ncbi:MAG: hypothetical protein NTV29_07985 [Planctomycetota bacterium]|jgi:hypothetical protein|nr:hypothetical protein [Planctomycetota bacterium]